MMPAGFSDRFRLHDANFLNSLSEEICADDIPTTLGGKNTVRKLAIKRNIYFMKQFEKRRLSNFERFESKFRFHKRLL